MSACACIIRIVSSSLDGARRTSDCIASGVDGRRLDRLQLMRRGRLSLPGCTFLFYCTVQICAVIGPPEPSF